MKRFSTVGLDKANTVTGDDRLKENSKHKIDRKNKYVLREKNMPTLNEINGIDRDRRIYLDEPTHIYYVDGVAVNTSATSLIKKFTGDFRPSTIFNRYLFKFASEENGWKATSKNYMGMTKEEILQKWENGRDFGTEVHGYIEKYLLDYPKFSHEKREEVRFHRLTHPDGFDKPAVDTKYLNCLKQFISWETKFMRRGWKPFYAERIVYEMEDYCFTLAGSVDAIYVREKDGKSEYAIIDWKTTSKVLTKSEGKGVYPFLGQRKSKMFDYSIQISIYRHFLQKYHQMENVSLCAVVQLNPSSRDYKEIPITEGIDVEGLLEIYNTHRATMNACVSYNKEENIGYDPMLFPNQKQVLRYQNAEEYL